MYQNSIGIFVHGINGNKNCFDNVTLRDDIRDFHNSGGRRAYIIGAKDNEAHVLLARKFGVRSKTCSNIKEALKEADKFERTYVLVAVDIDSGKNLDIVEYIDTGLEYFDDRYEDAKPGTHVIITTINKIKQGDILYDREMKDVWLVIDPSSSYIACTNVNYPGENTGIEVRNLWRYDLVGHESLEPIKAYFETLQHKYEDSFKWYRVVYKK